MASEFNIRLAQLVKSYPVIYDIMHPGYRKEDVKTKAWKCISDELDIPQSKCMIKWKSLKHQYVKCKKEGSAAWDMFEFMEFLDEGSTKTKGRKKKNARVAEVKAPATQDVPSTEEMDVETSQSTEEARGPEGSNPTHGTRKDKGKIGTTEQVKSPKVPKRTARGGSKANGTAPIPEPATKPTRGSPKIFDKTPVVVLNSDAVFQFQQDGRTLSVVPEQAFLEQEQASPPKVLAKAGTRKQRRQSVIPEPTSGQQGEPSSPEASKGKRGRSATKKPIEIQPADVDTEKSDEANQSDKAFAELLLERLAKLSPTIKPTIKASLLTLLGDATK